MKKKINYNYAFLFYDVKENRVNKVFKICNELPVSISVVDILLPIYFISPKLFL